MPEVMRNVGKHPVTVTQEVDGQTKTLFTVEPGDQHEMPSGRLTIRSTAEPHYRFDVDYLSRANQCGHQMSLGSMEDYELCYLDRGHEGVHVCGDGQYVLVGPMEAITHEKLVATLRGLTQ